MIRKSNILTLCLLLAMSMLTACNKDDGLMLEDARELSPAERLANADSIFLNLSIVNNSIVTRGTEDGSSQENAVYDGVLCIFEGDDATTATLRSAVAIDQLIYNPYEPRTVASGSAASINITQRLANTHAYADHVYAAVLLNTTRSGFYVENSRLYYRTKTINSNPVTFGTPENLTGSTFSTVMSHDIDDVGSTERHVGLFMKSGALVEATALYDTPEKASAGTAIYNEITVSRVAAKVIVHSVLTSGDNITNITLNGTSTKAKFHTMRWMLNPSPGYIDEYFTDFHQHALKSNDAVYVKPTSDATVVAELQVKDGSFLIDEGYIFHPYASSYEINNTMMYTNASQYLKYLKDGLTDWQKEYYDVPYRSPDEVYKHATIDMGEDGNVTITLINESFNSTEKAGLVRLAGALSTWTTGYRDGKMYYSFPVGNLAANTIYTLNFDDSSIPYIGRPTPTP